MHRSDIDGHIVISDAKSFGYYMPELAVALAERFGWEPGERYLSDLFSTLSTDESVFPPDLGDMGRRMRIERLLASPVQIDDLVLTLESGERHRAYQKIKKVVAVRGAIAKPEDVPSRVSSSYRHPSAAPSAPREESAALRRLDAIEAALKKHQEHVGKNLSRLYDILSVTGVPEHAFDVDRNENLVTLAKDLEILRDRVGKFDAGGNAEALRHQVEEALTVAKDARRLVGEKLCLMGADMNGLSARIDELEKGRDT